VPPFGRGGNADLNKYPQRSCASRPSRSWRIPLMPMAEDTVLNDIFAPTPEIARKIPRWSKDRDFVDGEDAVKAKGLTYLPLANPQDDETAYRAHLERTRFFPAASKTQQGWSGLIFRKRSQLNTSSQRIQTLAGMISPSGETLDELAEWIVRETLITNFTGLLVDHPSREGFQGLSAANADELGYRPFVSGYTAESILEITPGLVGNKRQIVRVRLLENNGNRVRELMLNQGVYQYRLWDKSDDTAIAGPVQTPLVAGKPLAEIPFVLVSTSDKLTPQPSLLQHVVDLNLQHYRVSGLMTSVLYFLSAPIPTVCGLKAAEDDEGEIQPIDLTVAPGAAWIFPESDTVVQYLEFKGQGAATIENQLKELKDELRIAGHSILAPDKPAPEAPETQMIYRAAETAILAGFARGVSKKLEKALKWFARWADPAAERDLAFALNQDFVPQGMDATEVSALLGAWQAGAISHATLLHAFRDGEVVSPALDIESEIESAKMEAADKPSLGLLT
jgi:hypothetical protein